MSDAALGADAAARRSFDDSAARHRPGPVYADRSAAREAAGRRTRAAQEAWRTGS